MSFVDVFQISVLALFLLVFGGRTLAMTLKGTRVIVLGAGKRMPGAALEVLFLIGLAVWCWEVVVHALHLDLHLFPAALYKPLVESSVLTAVGVIAIFSGFTIFVWALRSFGRSWRVGIDTRNPGKLVTSGAFSISRNPIFLFIDLYFAGAALIWFNPFFLAFALMTAVGIHYQTKQEERFLLNQYGAAYRTYSEHVRRYL
jgi:protein-S-isoprenylcysteine O-methyltransferase Ste14